MDILDTSVFVIASVALFLFGLQSFTKEIQTLSGGPLRSLLNFASKNRVIGTLFGMVATVTFQSSTVVTVLVIGLMDAGMLSLFSSLAIILGANIGTASTAFLISFKVQGIGAYFIILGALLSLLPIKIRVAGKTVFYFGFIFFALDQISFAMKPFYDDPYVLELLGHATNPLLGILAGIIITLVLQSSAVVTGFAVILAQQGLLDLEGAIAIVFGANIGTTATAVVASLAMSSNAKAAALANVLFSVVGVILGFFFIPELANFTRHLSGDNLGLAVAYAHFFFNLGITIFFIGILRILNDFLESYFCKKGPVKTGPKT